MNALTRDTLLLSEPTNREIQPASGLSGTRAINCTGVGDSPPLPERVADLVRDSLADNTRRAYASDLARFVTWGGIVPATDTHATATLARWLTSLAKAHRASGYPDPTGSELVKSTLRGIRRTHCTSAVQAKPLLRDDLMSVLDALGDDVKATRDRALLLIGFAGGFRRSELVGLDGTDIGHVRQGVILHLRRSKTDQTGVGRKIGIPHGRSRHCPVSALEVWVERLRGGTGPVFRPVNRHGHILRHRLSGEAVSIIVKQRLEAVRIDSSGYSGHSLRAGFATSAAQAGVSSWKIHQQTGHASDAMLARYIRDGELFVDNAAGALL